ncbi:MAG: hypothetical protein OHK0012_03550 [Synechococcales cyanobacterium]
MDAVHFLITYRFDLEGRPAPEWVQRWQHLYPEAWIPLGMLEAFYQGRFKAISVEHILRSWQRLGSPRLRFDPEFAGQLWPGQRWTILLPQLEQVVCEPGTPVPAWLDIDPPLPKRWHQLLGQLSELSL